MYVYKTLYTTVILPLVKNMANMYADKTLYTTLILPLVKNMAAMYADKTLYTTLILPLMKNMAAMYADKTQLTLLRKYIWRARKERRERKQKTMRGVTRRGRERADAWGSRLSYIK